MTFRAVHGQWGTVFAHLPDLGCGRAWEDVHRVRPSAPLTCAECKHALRPKVSPAGLRFFAHAPGSPHCSLARESLAHHLLKLELATAAREAGAHAEMEVCGPGGAWRADVLVSDPAGTWRVALEAQLSAITPEEIDGRVDRMEADGVPSVWFTDRLRVPWLYRVPSARLELVDDVLTVVEGIARFGGYSDWKPGPRMPLREFVRCLLSGELVLRGPGAVTYSSELTPLGKGQADMFWARVRCAEAADARERQEQEEERRREEDRRYERATREVDRERRRQRDEAVTALQERQVACSKRAWSFVREETGVDPYVEDQGMHAYAMGVPVYVGMRPYAVVCPVVSRVSAVRDRLASLVVLVASEQERERVAAQAHPGQRIVVLTDLTVEPSVTVES